MHHSPSDTLFALPCLTFHDVVGVSKWAPWWVMRPLSAVIPAMGDAEPMGMHAALAKTAVRLMGGEKAAVLADEPLFERRA